MGNTFKVVYDPLVVSEDLSHLDRSILLEIKKAIESKLVTNPDVYGKPLRGPLHGYWSLRVGDYRIAYRILARTVHVDGIEHRSVVYKTLHSRI